ncbi:hypothetical protein ACUH96_07855 [Dermabacteraceae bacterium P13077]
MADNRVENSTDFALSPGEVNVYGDHFLASLLTPYMKAQMMCSSTRFVFKTPNTLLGVVPLGFREDQMPIRNIAAVSLNTRFYLGRAFFAFILIMFFALPMIFSGGMWFLIGLFFLAWGGATAFMAFPTELKVTNPAGGTTSIAISSLEKSKVAKFREELQNRVFTDGAAVSHAENMWQRQQLHQQSMEMQQRQWEQMQQMQQQNQPVNPQRSYDPQQNQGQAQQ